MAKKVYDEMRPGEDLPDDVVNRGMARLNGEDVSRRIARDEGKRELRGLGDVIEHVRGEVERTRPETDAERRKRERREKWAGVVSGISDAVSSLAKLHYATQYAPYVEDRHGGMSAAARERFDRAKAERDAKAREHLRYVMELGNLEGKRRDVLWRQRQADALARFKEDEARRKAERDRLNLEIRQAQAEGNLDVARQRLEEQNRHNKSMEAVGRTRAAKSGGGRKGYTLHVGDETYKYDTKPEYDAAVIHFAKKYGVDPKSVSTTETGDGYITKTTTHTRAGGIADKAADLRDVKPAGGSSGKKGGYKAVGGGSAKKKNAGI